MFESLLLGGFRRKGAADCRKDGKSSWSRRWLEFCLETRRDGLAICQRGFCRNRVSSKSCWFISRYSFMV